MKYRVRYDILNFDGPFYTEWYDEQTLAISHFNDIIGYEEIYNVVLESYKRDS